MIDEDDVMFTALLMQGGGPWWLTIFGIIIVGTLWAMSCSDEDKCSKQHCDKGNPVLMRSECLCVEKAK